VGTGVGGDRSRAGRMVWAAAVVAFLARFPSLLWPLRPDEAGFLMVARAWQPEPDSLYGRYWVDRPPPIIWLVQATDRVAGPYAHRLVGALACSLLVLAAAAAAREVAVRAGVLDPAAVRRLAGWVAVATAALVCNAEIDPVAAKGELFGIPLVMASCWLALRAVRRVSAGDAFLAGLLAMLAVGMKQSIVGGLVFGAVLLAGSLVARQVSPRDALRCAVAAAAGAAVPVAVVVAWAVGAGVRLQTLWYAVVTFRSDASHVLATYQSAGATNRIWVLLLIFVGTGMLLVVALFAVRLRSLLRHDPVPVVAIAVMLLVDLLGVALSGSFWTPYLFVPLPGLALALAALVAHDHLDRVRHRLTPAAVGLVVVSSIVALVGWTGAWVVGRVPVEVRTGEAIAAAAWPGDRVLVYGGRADIQWATGTQSPYPYLWSLPMRTLDPGLDDLEEVLTGSNPPTWFVEATYITTWSELGTVAIQSSLIRKYEFVQTACGRYKVYHLNTVDPVEIDVDCSTPFRTIWGR
jgi:4-amino-4-deoxy-L-arabinose transferase-like glycosyltransferase